MEKNFKIDKKNNLYLSLLGNLFFVLCFLIALIFIVTSVVTIECEVEGESMQPTLNQLSGNKHDYVLVNKYDKTYDYGDIVVIERYGQKSIIKRILGLPGDVIDFVYDDEYVRLERNGEILVENYLKLRVSAVIDESDYDGMGMALLRWESLKKEMPEMFSNGKMTVGENEIFVLGDNRWVSLDSSAQGTYKMSRVVGVVEEIQEYGVSDFEFYWDYIVKGRFFKTIFNFFD